MLSTVTTVVILSVREAHAVILGTELSRRVVSARRQVPFPTIPRLEWDLTSSRDNSVPKKWQRGILFLTRSYHTIAVNLNKIQKQFLISFAFVVFEFIICYDRRRACATNYWPITDVMSKPKVKVVERNRDGLSHVWCDPTYFHYPTTKSTEMIEQFMNCHLISSIEIEEATPRWNVVHDFMNCSSTVHEKLIKYSHCWFMNYSSWTVHHHSSWTVQELVMKNK